MFTRGVRGMTKSGSLPETKLGLNGYTWICHICGQERSSKFISVLVTDVSLRHNLPEGTVFANTRYCNDRPACYAGAKNHKYIKEGE